jgi:hypothetical protein
MDTTELLSRLDNWRPYHGDINTQWLIEQSTEKIRELTATLDDQMGTLADDNRSLT